MRSGDTNLSLVGACAPVEVEEAVAVRAQVATDVAEDDSRSLAVVVVVTHGLQVQKGDVMGSLLSIRSWHLKS